LRVKAFQPLAKVWKIPPAAAVILSSVKINFLKRVLFRYVFDQKDYIEIAIYVKAKLRMFFIKKIDMGNI